MWFRLVIGRATKASGTASNGSLIRKSCKAKGMSDDQMIPIRCKAQKANNHLNAVFFRMFCKYVFISPSKTRLDTPQMAPIDIKTLFNGSPNARIDIPKTWRNEWTFKPKSLFNIPVSNRD